MYYGTFLGVKRDICRNHPLFGDSDRVASAMHILSKIRPISFELQCAKRSLVCGLHIAGHIAGYNSGKSCVSKVVSPP